MNLVLLMKTYLVGGAVRDMLLGLEVFDRDFVVVAGSSQDMLDKGFKQVGLDFPVFLHPKTHEEYALARMERKVALGYTGFEVCTEGVSLEQDLSRRDLTINAMAIEVGDSPQTIIDPFAGQKDLAQGLLRHISPAFSEDPVRILRVARLGARFAPFGFKVAHNTHKLMRYMVDSGEVDSLVPERVWAELSKALTYEYASVFFKILNACGALAVVLPELSNIKHKNHQNHFAFLDKVKSDNIAIKWAVLCANLTPAEVSSLCQHICCPKVVTKLAKLSAKYSGSMSGFSTWSSSEVLAFFLSSGAFGQGDKFKNLLKVFVALGIDTMQIVKIWQAILSLDIAAMDKTNIATELPKKRLLIIQKILNADFIAGTHNHNCCKD